MSPMLRELEFDCIECGRHVIRFIAFSGDPLLCAQCIFLPGWFRDPQLREMLDPDHDGKEKGVNDLYGR